MVEKIVVLMDVKESSEPSQLIADLNEHSAVDVAIRHPALEPENFCGKAELENYLGNLIKAYDLQDAYKLPQQELASIVEDISYDLMDLREKLQGNNTEEKGEGLNGE